MRLQSELALIVGVLLLSSDLTHAQTRRTQSPRAGPTGRALGVNPKTSSSSSTDFNCPEEFGYFAHPTDCSLYYVCVFGGALLESCTGGLMYSHELQTCDWPRNVGCEVAEVSQSQAAIAAPTRSEVTPRVPQVQSKVRFSSLNLESPSAPSAPSGPSAPAHIQQIQTLPPPPNQQNISPKPIITSRGQPPSFSTQDEILKQLYAEAHDTLPPAEEEESDRQQRVYRGQPSTVTQVQRDRDGIIHQPSVNAIPTQQKVGSFAFSNSQIPTNFSEDELQDLDNTKPKILDRKRRDLSSTTDSDDKYENPKSEEPSESNQHALEKRSNSKETFSSFDEVSELLEGSENNDDVQRRTRQLRPSIISSPWRISSARAVNFAPSNQNSFGSNFPSATSGFLYKSDGRFYPSNPFKSSQDNFSPVISTYSGNNKKFGPNTSFQSFNSGSFNHDDSSERDHESQTPKYKQSSKIPSHSSQSSSSGLLPLLYSLESFEHKPKSSTPPPVENQDNYSYFHIGKNTQNDKVKTFAFPISNQPATSTQRPFISFNSVGGFFNNNQQSPSNQGFSPVKHSAQNTGHKATPAPIYEGTKSASSYDSRHTTPAPAKSVSPSQSSFNSNPFLNNLSFKGGSQSVFNFGSENNDQNGRKQHEEKIVEITTKKHSYKQHQYPIPTSTPKYIPSYTTPNQLFDVDKFIAELRETQRLQNIQKTIAGNNAGHYKNKTLNFSNNQYQIFTSPAPPTSSSVPISTTLSDDYYYEDDDEVEEDEKLSVNPKVNKFNTQQFRIKDNHSSFSINKKPNLINSNAAINDEDEYYDEYEDEEEFQFLPPPVNKPKYTPMTETMAPRPINVTTLRPYHVSGQTFSTPPPVTSTIPSIIKFPDDVFQAIRPFTSLAPKNVYNNNNSKNKPSNGRPINGNFEITKAPPKALLTERTTERTTTRKIKIVTKPTTKKFNIQHQVVTTTTTIKPSRTTARTKSSYANKLNRGNSRFKPSTKRPDLTRLEIDEKLPNRVEQSSPAPPSYNIPSKTQIYTQNKNYYNTSNNNYNSNSDSAYYPIYDDDVEIYRDVDYSNIYNNQPKSTPSSTYRPSTTQTPQTYKPITQSTTYLTQTPAPKQKYNSQQDIYSASDYDEALVAQLEESERYGEDQPSGFRGDRNELNSLSDNAIIKVSSPSNSKSPKYPSVSVPAIVALSTPEPFSFKPTTSVVRTSFSSQLISTTSTIRSTTVFSTTPSSTFALNSRTTNGNYYTTRSTTLSDGSSNNNKTATNRNRLTLSSRAGSFNPFYVPILSRNPIISSPQPSPSNIHSISPYTETLLTTTAKTFTSTMSKIDPISTTSTTEITTPKVQIVNLKPIKNVNPLPDQYYYSEPDKNYEYYDTIDEITIPSSTIKPLSENRSSSSVSEASLQVKSFIFPNVESELKFKLSSLNEPRYDQSTLKSFFMNNVPSTTTEGISLANLKKLLTTTEKITNTNNTSAQNFEKQRQKILSFIISENQPSSFKVPSTSPSTSMSTASTQFNSTQKSETNQENVEPQPMLASNINSNSNKNAFVNKPQVIESSTMSTLFTNIPLTRVQISKTTKLLSRDRNRIRLTPSNNLDNFNKKPSNFVNDQLPPKELLEEIQLFKSRQPEGQSLYLKPIEPTTYSPMKPYRATTEATKSQISSSTQNAINNYDNDDDAIENPEKFEIHSRRRPYVNDYLSSTRFPIESSSSTPIPEIASEKITTQKTLKATSSAKEETEAVTYKPSTQSFTSRGLIFKEILNKTFDPQANSKPIVSPYISLETQRLTNAIRTTTAKNAVAVNKEPTTESSPLSTSSTYRSFFFITAPPKNISTYLFPETSSTTNPTSILNNKFSSTTPQTLEYNRGKYRPYSLSSQVPNSIDEGITPTTYSPRTRFNTRSNLLNEFQISSTTSEQPAVRRKVIRLKSALSPPIEKQTDALSTTERADITTFTPSKRIFIESNFIPSPTRDTSDFRPIITKLNEFINRLSNSADLFDVSTAPSQDISNLASNNELINDKQKLRSQISQKPVLQNNKFLFNNINNSNLSKLTDTHDTFTKKFSAPSEMPEIKFSQNKFNDEKLSFIKEEKEEKLPYNDNIDSLLDERMLPIKNNAMTLANLTEYQTSTMTTTSVTTNNDLVLSTSTTTVNPKSFIPPRATRVNNQLKSSIIASGLPRRNSNSASIKCNDVSSNAQCNEIPSRNPTRNRDRGTSSYTGGETQSTVSGNRGTSPPRQRPTLKPSQSIVKDAQPFADIYKFPPSRPEPLYPQPTPDKTAAKCRKDVCLLPDCSCGGKDIPGDLPVDQVPQIVLLTFDDSVNDLNKQLYSDLFERGRVNPNGCPISATFYVSHEWTDYSQVQNLYSDGHEMASHTVSHSFGEQFSLKKWAREIAGQREILSAYGGVKQEDIRGMRAPFLSIGGNKMFKMLHDFNFTYDSSMPIYENRPPSWPYTLDYKIFHDCMIPPCPTKSYPGVWEVPMVMWQDLNGGRCSMGDACSNPAESENVFKMIMKNFERHYTTNRAPFGLFYHAAWFTQPHHKEGFIQFLDTINRMKDVYIVTNWQAIQWVRDPTPLSRMNSFQPFQCNYQDRPKRCNNPKVCNLWHKSGVRYMRTCQPCPEIYPWTGKTGIRSSRIDNDLEVVEST